MRTSSLLLLAAVASAVPMAAQSKAAVPSAAPTRISDAEVSEDGAVRIRFSNGRSVQVPPGKGHAGREQLQVARSRSAVGWLDVDVPVGSYSVPTTLTVYTVGKPLKHFGDGLVLVDWKFVDGDRHIRFSSTQAHGPGADWLTIEVHDIETGRLLKRWLEQSETAAPRVPLPSITGRVTDSAGAPLNGTVVSVRAQPAAEPFALTISSEDGRFTLQGIQPGEHELRFEHPRFKGRAVKVTVGSSERVIDAGVVTLASQAAR
jgi:Carboxypeptidase regulatory-like domain